MHALPNTNVAKRGFTMVEMVITIAVVGVVFAIGGMVLGRAFQAYDVSRKTTDVDWQGRVATERVVRELRQIRSATAADLSIASLVRIWFVDEDGNNVCFYLNGASQLMRSDATSAANCSVAAVNIQPLADNVTSLNIDYYDNTGAVTAVVTSAYYITVRLAVNESSAAGNITDTYRVTVQPRRF